MRNSALVLLLLVLAPLVNDASAKTFDIACPERISTAQRLLGGKKGWAGFVDSEPEHAYISGVSIYYGHPRDMAMLKPDEEMVKEQYWTFGRSPEDSLPLYMACNYHTTLVRLIRTLPPSTKKCTNKRLGMLRCETFDP